MGVLLAFAVGYTVGAKAGAKGFEEVVASLKAIRESDEFAAMLSALRSHVGYALREVADVMNESEAPAVGDILDRVRNLVRPKDATSSEF